jgi:hypothetical protein
MDYQSYHNKNTPVKEIAAVMRVTPRRIYQLKKHHEETGQIPELRQNWKENSNLPTRKQNESSYKPIENTYLA